MMHFHKILLSFCIVILFSFSSYSQETTLTDNSSTNPLQGDHIYKVVEEMPRFPGCEDQDMSTKEKDKCSNEKLYEYVFSILKYPKKAQISLTEGMAVIQFIVAKDGSIPTVNIVRNPGNGTGEEAKRIVESFNDMDVKWRPGYHKGIAVNVQYTLPIKFKLDEEVHEAHNTDKIFLVSEVDQEPIFPDCKNDEDSDCSKIKFKEFIAENQLYPELALENNTEGNVKVTFVVEINGTISNIKVLNKTDDDGISDDAIDVINWMNSEEMYWIPGMKNNEPVRTIVLTDIEYNIKKWKSRN